MRYRYSATSGQSNVNGRNTKRPVVELEISRGNHKRRFLALIDSGADQIMMPAAIADVLDIDRSACPARTSLGVSMEPIEGFVSNLTLRIEHQMENFDAPVIFIDTDIPVLLGREGFFDLYRIKFEQDHDTFELSPSPN